MKLIRKKIFFYISIICYLSIYLNIFPRKAAKFDWLRMLLYGTVLKWEIFSSTFLQPINSNYMYLVQLTR